MDALSERLNQFNIFKIDGSTENLIPFNRLMMDIESVIILLNNLYQSSSIDATASTFIKRYSIIPSLYQLLTKDNLYLNFSLDDLYFSFNNKKHTFYLKEYTTSFIEPQDKEKALRLMTQFIFTKMLNPLVEVLTTVSKLPVITYYDHMAYIIDYYYSQNPVDLKILNHMKSLEADLFNLEFNPLNVTFKEEYIPELKKWIKIRRSCCLKYLLKDEPSCYTCPHINMDHRISILKRI